jgi:hypothetical protein
MTQVAERDPLVGVESQRVQRHDDRHVVDWGPPHARFITVQLQTTARMDCA